MPELLETSVFTKRISALGLEESLRSLQLELLHNPEAGDVEPGTSGERKVRLGDPRRGKGKRGGRARPLPLAAPPGAAFI